jgi:hypothetical protein
MALRERSLWARVHIETQEDDESREEMVLKDEP